MFIPHSLFACSILFAFVMVMVGGGTVLLIKNTSETGEFSQKTSTMTSGATDGCHFTITLSASLSREESYLLSVHARYVLVVDSMVP